MQGFLAQLPDFNAQRLLVELERLGEVPLRRKHDGHVVVRIRQENVLFANMQNRDDAERLLGPIPQRPLTLRVALRSDLGQPGWKPELAVSSATGQGIPGLVRLISDRLVPPETRHSTRLWRFW